MTQDYFSRPYRPCAGIVLTNAAGMIFIGQRLDNSLDAWQMPQGGIDDGETPIEAGFREMLEEVGTNKAELIAEHSRWLSYDLPLSLADQLWHSRYRGQTQKWMLFRFTGDDADINISTPEPEFRSWRWIDRQELPSLTVSFKRPIYEDVLSEFADLF